MGFSLVGVSFAVLRITDSSADLSYVLAAQISPMLIFALISGVFADRFPPQRVIAVANLTIVAGESTFGILVLTTRPPLWAMICLEALTGIGMAMFYPASTALLPQLVPQALLQEASSISRIAMNVGQTFGAAVGGLLVAAAGPGWAMTLCGVAMTGTVPLMLALKSARAVPVSESPGMLRELRDGWAEVRSRTWLWIIITQFCVVMAAWYGGVQVLGPVVARQHLGGAAAWGAITASESCGLIVGGLVSLRFSPQRPMLFCVLAGALVALSPLSLALVLPLSAVCTATFILGIANEVMMVLWMVTLARAIPPDKLARVSSYDALGSLAAMPLGALAAAPVSAAIGVSGTQFGAAGLIVAVSLLCLIPRDIRSIRADDLIPGGTRGRSSSRGDLTV
jgi:predicted MFS family arabinose efflux permease